MYLHCKAKRSQPKNPSTLNFNESPSSRFPRSGLLEGAVTYLFNTIIFSICSTTAICYMVIYRPCQSCYSTDFYNGFDNQQE